MAYETVIIKGENPMIEEKEANAALSPGFLIELLSTDKVRKHAGDDAFAIPLFALEDELQGKEYSEAYAAGDKVRCWRPRPGDQVLARLADGENVAIGDKLGSNGDGYLRKYVAPESAIEETGAIVA